MARKMHSSAAVLRAFLSLSVLSLVGPATLWKSAVAQEGGDCEEAPDAVVIEGCPDESPLDFEPVILTAVASGVDGAITYEWTVVGALVTSPPPHGATVTLACDPGEVIATVRVTDEACDDVVSATCSFECVHGDAVILPGDGNFDGSINLIDAVFLLQLLFAEPAAQACLLEDRDGRRGLSASAIVLLDWNGDDRVDVSDAVATLLWLFAGRDGGAPHVLGTDCQFVSARVGCPPSCDI